MDQLRLLETRLPSLQLSPDVCSVAAGVFAFGSSMALSTLIQGRLLRASTGSMRPIPTLCGMVSVGLASVVSHQASVVAHQFVSTGTTDFGKYARRSSDDISIGDFAVSKQTLRIVALGLLSFKLLGGRFWAIAPSSYTHIGSFARASIPAKEQYATKAERVALARIGRVWGCHTCGTRLGFGKTMIADHQPPKAVAAQMNQNFWRRITDMKVKYRFFPQCGDCSQKQGIILSSATRKQVTDFWSRTNLAGSGGGRTANYHGLKFRLNHLTGGVIAAATVLGASGVDIANGNIRRFEGLQQLISGGGVSRRPGKTRNMH